MVSANHADIDETVSISDDNLQTSSNDYGLDVVGETHKENNENFRYSTSSANMDTSSGEVVKDSNSVLNFSSLNETINSNSSSEIKLDNDYLYDDTTDSRFISLGGIVVNRNLTIDGQGHTIDLGGKVRFLNVTRCSITLKNINIKNGYANTSGGAVCVIKGSGSFINCNFTSNIANTSGGAVYIENDTGIFNNTQFTGNIASNYGGSVYIFKGIGNFISSTFTDNAITSQCGGAVAIFIGNGEFTKTSFFNNNATDAGGAVYITGGNGNFLNSKFNNNLAYFGGAVQIIGGNVTFKQSTFTSNNATVDGGAVYTNNANVIFDNSLLEYNHASNHGGAIYTSESNNLIQNTQFEYNNASKFGGAIYTNGSTSSIENSVFNNSKASSGSGVYITNGNGSFVKSTFVANIHPIYATLRQNVSVDQNTVANSDKNLTDAVYMNASVKNYTYDTTGLINITFNDPISVVNEGVVYVIISNKSYTANVSDNNALIYLNDLDCGYYEGTLIFNGSVNYYKTYIPISFGVFRSFSSLNETINSDNSSVIYLTVDYLFNENTDSRFINLGGIVVNRNLTIDGQGHTIDLAGKTRFLYNFKYYITLKNVIIKNGYGNYGGAIYSYGDSGNYVGCINTTFINNNVNEEGGAVCILNAGIGNFTNCTFINNSAKSQSGAVAINFATGIFIDTIFEGNTVLNSAGGAVHINEGQGTFINSTFRGNKSPLGGAIRITRYKGLIENCLFESNNATEYHGGAVYLDSAECTFINSVFKYNTASKRGGSICFDEGSGSITNSTFIGNEKHIEVSVKQNITIDRETILNSDENLDYAVYINTTINDFDYGSTGLINVLLSNLKFINEGVMYVTISNKTFTANVSYNRANIYLNDLNIVPGVYDMNLTFNGTKNYFKTFIPINFTVSMANSTINLTTDDVVYGEDVLINVTTSCEDSVVYLEIDGVIYATNLTNGKGTINMTGINTGNYNLNVIYNGTQNYKPCNAPIRFTVNKANSTINVTTEDVNYGENVLINVTTECPDSVVYVEINGVIYAANITNGKGTINITGLNANNYNLNVNYNGTENYNPCMNPVNFTINKLNSTINVTTEDVNYGETVFINVSSDCEDGEIYITINNQTYKGYIHNGKGQITIQNLEPGHYEANVTYNGSTNYNPCTEHISFNVSKAYSSINVTTEDVVYGEDVLINITTDCEDSVVYLEIDGVIYATNLTNGKGTINITGINTGNYNLNVIYNGTQNYKPCNAPIRFTVNKANSTINVTTEDVNYGENVLINVTTECPDSVVYVEINGVIYAANITNGKGTINITGLNANNYNLNVNYNGTENYNPCMNPVNFTINKLNSTINVTTEDVNYGETVFINVSSDCEDGEIYITINNQTYKGYIHNGKGQITIQNLEPGHYEANVTYNGSTNYNPCINPVNFNVMKKDPTLIISNVEIINQDVLITVFTTGEDSVVSITINNKTYSGNIVNYTGVINITGLKPNNYTGNVTYVETSHYKSSSTPVNFTINKKSTSIIASAATYTLNYDNTYKVTFNPKLAGFKLTFSLNGKIIGSAVTDSSGVASIKLTKNQLKSVGAGKHNMIVSFAGDEEYLASNVTKTITINKEATKFINVKSVKKSYKSTAKSMQLTATLKDSKNKVIKSQWVYFKVNNKKTYKIKTNSKGVATLNLNAAKIKACKLNKKGNYKFTVSYITTATYKQASGKGTIKVLN